MELIDEGKASDKAGVLSCLRAFDAALSNSLLGTDQLAPLLREDVCLHGDTVVLPARAEGREAVCQELGRYLDSNVFQHELLLE